MGWVFLEILAALAVAVAIVWWTWPRDREPPGDKVNEGEARGRREPGES